MWTLQLILQVLAKIYKVIGNNCKKKLIHKVFLNACQVLNAKSTHSHARDTCWSFKLTEYVLRNVKMTWHFCHKITIIFHILVFHWMVIWCYTTTVLYLELECAIYTVKILLLSQDLLTVPIIRTWQNITVCQDVKHLGIKKKNNEMTIHNKNSQFVS